MKKIFEQTLSELMEYSVEVDFKSGFEKDGIENDFVVKLMIFKQLDRIADALERIEDKLDSIDDSLEMLNRCIGYISPNPYQKEGYHILRIGGGVDIGN